MTHEDSLVTSIHLSWHSDF